MEKINYKAYRKDLKTPLRKLDDHTYLVDDSLFIEKSDHYAAQLGLVGGQEVESFERLDQGYKLTLAGLPQDELQKINWMDRLQFMQFSLCRVLYSLAFNHLLSIKTLNFYIGKDRASILLEAEDLPYRSLDRIESLVAHTIQANLLVSQTKIDQGVLIRVADYPLQKSQGPHLLRTGEIGFSRITDLKKTDDGLVLDFICGHLAHQDYLDLAKNMGLLSEFLRCPLDQVPDQVKRRIMAKDKTKKVSLDQEGEKKVPSDLKTEEESPDPLTKEEDLSQQAEENFKEETTPPPKEASPEKPSGEKETPSPEEPKKENLEDKPVQEDKYQKDFQNMVQDFKAQASEVGGISYIYRNLKDISLREVKEVSAKIMDEDNYIQIYGLPSPDISPFLVCLSKNRSEDVKKIFDHLKKDYQLEGSGNYLRVQGSVKTENLPSVMEQFLAGIQGQIENEKEKE